MHLLYQIGDKVGTVRYKDATVFRNETDILDNGGYVILASGMYWGCGAKIKIKVNGKTVAQGTETVSYAGFLMRGDKVQMEATNLINSHLMVFEVK